MIMIMIMLLLLLLLLLVFFVVVVCVDDDNEEHVADDTASAADNHGDDGDDDGAGDHDDEHDVVVDGDVDHDGGDDDEDDDDDDVDDAYIAYMMGDANGIWLLTTLLTTTVVLVLAAFFSGWDPSLGECGANMFDSCPRKPTHALPDSRHNQRICRKRLCLLSRSRRKCTWSTLVDALPALVECEEFHWLLAKLKQWQSASRHRGAESKHPSVKTSRPVEKLQLFRAATVASSFAPLMKFPSWRWMKKLGFSALRLLRLRLKIGKTASATKRCHSFGKSPNPSAFSMQSLMSTRWPQSLMWRQGQAQWCKPAWPEALSITASAWTRTTSSGCKQLQTEPLAVWLPWKGRLFSTRPWQQRSKSFSQMFWKAWPRRPITKRLLWSQTAPVSEDCFNLDIMAARLCGSWFSPSQKTNLLWASLQRSALDSAMAFSKRNQPSHFTFSNLLGLV